MKRFLVFMLCLVLSIGFMTTSAMASYEARCGIAKENEDWIVNFKGGETGNGNVHEHQMTLSGDFETGSGLNGIWSDLHNTVVADIITCNSAVLVHVTQPMETLRIYQPMTVEKLKQIKKDDITYWWDQGANGGTAFDLTSFPVLSEGLTTGDNLTLTEPGYYFIEGKLPDGDMNRAILVCVGEQAGPTSRYQSTAQLTKGSIADLNYNDFALTITNPTDNYDSGTVALVLASDKASLHFVDYALAPQESKTYSVTVAGHMGIKYGHQLTLLDGGWGAFLNAAIITFESDKDRDAYRNAAVYEKNIDNNVTQGSGNGANAHVIICNGQPGDDWLKKYTGIGRHHKPYLDPAINHDICKH